MEALVEAELLNVDRTKSAIDTKHYRLIKLECGARVLLIHDPASGASASSAEDGIGEEDEDDSDASVSASEGSADDEDDGTGDDDEESSKGSAGAKKHIPSFRKCYVAMCVGSGSYQDPESLPGIAHFCEHMLFMGSEQYPGENMFDEFISEHGGYTNAFTELEYTCYQFEATPAALPGAMDRFAAFFARPLFAKDSVQREVQAIESEFNQALSSDQSRLQQLQCGTIALTGYPSSRFTWGNLESIITAPQRAGIDPLTALRDWFGSHYCEASRWHLVVRCNGAALPSYQSPADASATDGGGSAGAAALAQAYAGLNSIEATVRSSFRVVDKKKAARGKISSSSGGGGSSRGDGEKKRAKASTPPARPSSATAAAATAAHPPIRWVGVGGGGGGVLPASEALRLLLPEQLGGAWPADATAASGAAAAPGEPLSLASPGVLSLLSTARSDSVLWSSRAPSAPQGSKQAPQKPTAPQASRDAFSPVAAHAAACALIAPGTVAERPSCSTVYADVNPFFFGPPGSYPPAGASPLRVPAFLSAPRERDSHTLQLSWALPPLLGFYVSRPEELLGFALGHEAGGSILAALKARGWASEVSAGVHRGSGADCNGSGSTMSVSVTATAAGAREWRRVVGVVCSYIVHVLSGGISVAAPALPQGSEEPHASASSSGGGKGKALAAAPAASSGSFPLRCAGVATLGPAPGVPGPIIPLTTLCALHDSLCTGPPRATSSPEAVSKAAGKPQPAGKAGRSGEAAPASPAPIDGSAAPFPSSAAPCLAALYPEIAAMAAVRYHATTTDEEEDGALEAVTKLACAMVCGAADERVVDGGALLGPWAPGAVTVLLAHLSPAHMRIDLQSSLVTDLPGGVLAPREGSGEAGHKGATLENNSASGAASVPAAEASHCAMDDLLSAEELEGSLLAVEKWFATPFRRVCVDAATVRSWVSPPAMGELHLPQRNPYLPAHLDVVPLPGEQPAAATPVGAAAAAAVGGGGGREGAIKATVKGGQRGRLSAAPQAAPAPSSTGGRRSSAAPVAPVMIPNRGGEAAGRGSAGALEIPVGPESPTPMSASPPRLMACELLLPQPQPLAAPPPQSSAAAAAAGNSALACRLWFKQDDTFRLPMTHVRIIIHTPVQWSPLSAYGRGSLPFVPATSSSATLPPGLGPSSHDYAHLGIVRALSELALRAAQDELSSDLYFAELGELHGSLEGFRNGVIITLAGVSQALPRLLARVLEALLQGGDGPVAGASLPLSPVPGATAAAAGPPLSSPAPDPASCDELRFRRTRETLLRDLRNLHMDVGAAACFVRDCLLEAHIPATAAGRPAAVVAALESGAAGRMITERMVREHATARQPQSKEGGAHAAAATALRSVFASFGLLDGGEPATGLSKEITPVPSQQLPHLWWSCPTSPVLADMLVFGNESEASSLALYGILRSALASAVITGDSAHATAPAAPASASSSEPAAVSAAALPQRSSIPPEQFDGWCPAEDVVLLPHSSLGSRLPAGAAPSSPSSAAAPASVSPSCGGDITVSAPSLSPAETNHCVLLYLPLGLDENDHDDSDGGEKGGEPGSGFPRHRSNLPGPRATFLPMRRAAAIVLASLASEPAFNALRTQQQLGYSVSLRLRCLGDAASCRAVHAVQLPSDLRFPRVPVDLRCPRLDGPAGLFPWAEGCRPSEAAPGSTDGDGAGSSSSSGGGSVAAPSPLPMAGPRPDGSPAPSPLLAGRVLALALSVESASHSPEEVSRRMVTWVKGFRAQLAGMCGMEGEEEEGGHSSAPKASSSSPAAAPQQPPASGKRSRSEKSQASGGSGELAGGKAKPQSPFERHVAACIEEKLSPDVHMAEQADRLWHEIVSRRQSFRRLALEVEALRRLAPADVLRLFDAAAGSLPGVPAAEQQQPREGRHASVMVVIRGQGATDHAAVSAPASRAP